MRYRAARRAEKCQGFRRSVKPNLANGLAFGVLPILRRIRPSAVHLRAAPIREHLAVRRLGYHHFINGKKTLLAADTITLLRPNDTHCLRTASKNGVHHYNITFRDELMRR
jgi:hypothetical protein